MDLAPLPLPHARLWRQSKQLLAFFVREPFLFCRDLFFSCDAFIFCRHLSFCAKRPVFPYHRFSLLVFKSLFSVRLSRAECKTYNITNRQTPTDSKTSQIPSVCAVAQLFLVASSIKKIVYAVATQEPAEQATKCYKNLIT